MIGKLLRRLRPRSEADIYREAFERLVEGMRADEPPRSRAQIRICEILDAASKREERP